MKKPDDKSEVKLVDYQVSDSNSSQLFSENDDKTLEPENSTKQPIFERPEKFVKTSFNKYVDADGGSEESSDDLFDQTSADKKVKEDKKQDNDVKQVEKLIKDNKEDLIDTKVK